WLSRRGAGGDRGRLAVHGDEPRARQRGGAAAGGRGRRDRSAAGGARTDGDERRGARPLLQHARAAQVPQGGDHRARRHPARDPALLQATLAAYRPLLARDRFPLVVLAIDMPPQDVDANVHPTKAWVRFRNPRLVQEMLVAALHAALRAPDVVPTMGAAGSA